jgi:hypothetical protein
MMPAIAPATGVAARRATFAVATSDDERLVISTSSGLIAHATDCRYAVGGLLDLLKSHRRRTSIRTSSRHAPERSRDVAVAVSEPVDGHVDASSTSRVWSGARRLSGARAINSRNRRSTRRRIRR